MLPKKNRANEELAQSVMPVFDIEAYNALRIRGVYTIGLGIFLKLGMLEWMRAAEKPAMTGVYKTGVTESSCSGRDEIVIILANMMGGDVDGI